MLKKNVLEAQRMRRIYTESIYRPLLFVFLRFSFCIKKYAKFMLPLDCYISTKNSCIFQTIELHTHYPFRNEIFEKLLSSTRKFGLCGYEHNFKNADEKAHTFSWRKKRTKLTKADNNEY